MEDNEIPISEDVREHVEKQGLSGIEECFRRHLEKWKDVEITIGVTGDAGAGMSSLINAISGFRVAETGVTDTTKEPTEYTHPQNKNIKFWDLPGLGTPSCPDVKNFCEKVDLKKYNIFLILSAFRFTNNNLQVAKKVESMNKSFFFVRTKIDQDIEDQKFDYKEKDEESILSEIREDFQENLSGLEGSNKKVFLISNRHQEKWDFPCLREAILDALLPHQRDSLILSLTADTKDVMKLKVKALQDRIWMVAVTSAAVAVLPVPGLSIAFDAGLLMKEINFYKSQLGIPEENSTEFQGMTSEIKGKILKYCVTSAVEVGHLLQLHITSSTAEEIARFFPTLGNAIAGGISFASTYWFLYECVKELEETAFNLLDETRGRVAEKLDRN